MVSVCRLLLNYIVISPGQTVRPKCFGRVEMSQRCGHCKVSVIAVQSESRSLALMRFSQLQRQGHLPTMCESANGQFTVCYDAAERRLVEYPGAATGKLITA